VDIFEHDERFDDLLDAQGWVGFGVYFFLCQQAYATNGYYLKWGYDNAARTARKMGGGIKADTVKQAVSLCLRLGLFDNRLFDRDRVLTSRGLQKGWMNAVEKRAVNGRTIDPEIWLLKSTETKPFICVPENPSFLPENPSFLPENDHKSRVEYSRVENKNNICGTVKPPTTRKKFIIPCVEEIAAYCSERGNNVNAEQFFDFYQSKGWKVGKNPMKDWKAAVRTWERNGFDKPKEPRNEFRDFIDGGGFL
jgi:hypothetical protein